MLGDGIMSVIVPRVAEGKRRAAQRGEDPSYGHRLLGQARWLGWRRSLWPHTLGEIMRCLGVPTMVGDRKWHVVAPGGRCLRQPCSQEDQANQVHADLLGALCLVHAEHVARFETTVTHAAQTQQSIENFEGKDFQDAVEEAHFLKQVVKNLPVFLAECKKV